MTRLTKEASRVVAARMPVELYNDLREYSSRNDTTVGASFRHAVQELLTRDASFREMIRRRHRGPNLLVDETDEENKTDEESGIAFWRVVELAAYGSILGVVIYVSGKLSGFW